jgi:pyruvate/2-oxoglutarate dehydrogenase complex dihydrolipoamide dehydrogenase (E3) component
VRLNTTVDPSLAAAEDADTLVVALGARPIVPPFISNCEHASVFAAEQAYADPGQLGKDVVIIGAGLVGCELGIYLDSLGYNVTILEMASTIGFGDNVLHGQAIDVKIAQTNIDLRLNTKVTKIECDSVLAEGENGPESFKAGSVVYAIGYEPLRSEALALANCAPEVYRIGDCVTPATIWSAVREAFSCANDIGEFDPFLTL